MNIEEAKQAKEDAENKIEIILQELYEKTECFITGIELAYSRPDEILRINITQRL